MRKIAFLFFAAAVLVTTQTVVHAAPGQTDSKGKVKVNFTPGNKHQAAAAVAAPASK
jgi:hypothetical protein